MLTPRADDPNREKELARIKNEPWTAGMEPGVKTKEQTAAEIAKNANTKK